MSDASSFRKQAPRSILCIAEHKRVPKHINRSNAFDFQGHQTEWSFAGFWHRPTTAFRTRQHCEHCVACLVVRVSVCTAVREAVL